MGHIMGVYLDAHNETAQVITFIILQVLYLLMYYETTFHSSIYTSFVLQELLDHGAELALLLAVYVRVLAYQRFTEFYHEYAIMSAYGP